MLGTPARHILGLPLTDQPVIDQTQPRTDCQLESKLKLSTEKFPHILTATSTKQNARTTCDIQVILKQMDTFFCFFFCRCGGRIKTTVVDKKRLGFAVYFQSTCEECDNTTGTYTSETVPGPNNAKPFTVNRHAVLAALKVDMGAYRLNNFCETLNMPSVYQSTFVKKAKQCYALSADAGRQMFDTPAGLVKEQHQFMNFDAPDNRGRMLGSGTTEDSMDILVSFDGPWLTPGFSLLVGVGCINDFLTGLIIDAHVMSAHCQECAVYPQCDRDANPAAYDAWLIEQNTKIGKSKKGILLAYSMIPGKSA